MSPLGSSSSCVEKLVTLVLSLAFLSPLECSLVNGERNSGTLDNLSSSSAGGGGGGSSNSFYNNEAWMRNLDNQLLRLGSRLDQLMIRMDHLDSRVGRVQSQGHLRFDSIETSMQTTRQRLDLWSSQLNMMEETITRKWKNMESRFDSLVSAMDAKLDTKFNLIQRDNRRHNEFISSNFNTVIISHEKLGEKIVNRLAEVNSTLHHTAQSISNSTRSLQLSQSVTQNNTIQLLENFSKNLTRSCSGHFYAARSSMVYDQNLPHHNPHHHHHGMPSANASLISTKVSNMFDELVKRSQDLEAIVKDTFTMSNLTRREVQDGFRAVIPVVTNQLLGSGSRNSNSNVASSAEIMSGMIVESLASVESMSSALNRRMNELTRSLEEKNSFIAMSLNGLLESCIRIQEKTPLLEERLADTLDRILDTVDNRTQHASETWTTVHQLLRNYSSSCLLNRNINATTIDHHYNNTEESTTTHHHLLHRGNVTTTVDESNKPPDNNEMDVLNKLDNIGELSEDEKKRFWESWLIAPIRTTTTTTSDVPDDDVDDVVDED